jgi:hypothetical protein
MTLVGLLVVRAAAWPPARAAPRLAWARLRLDDLGKVIVVIIRDRQFMADVFLDVG